MVWSGSIRRSRPLAGMPIVPNTQINGMKKLIILNCIGFVAGCTVIALAGAPASSQAGVPVVAPPGSRPFGLTYGEWSARHWQWLFSAPVSQNPLFMDGAVDLSLHQPEGRVWFLGGTFTVNPAPGGGVIGHAVRSGTVPFGKALFFPILDCEWDNPTSPPGDYTTAELRAQAKAQMDSITELDCELDGVPVKHLQAYRVSSPVFKYWLPAEDNVVQAGGMDVSGWVTGVVADGIYLMLEPMSVGQHTIHFAGSVPGFSLDITYHIKVVPHH